MSEAPFTDNYRFTGPTVAVSCEVDYDKNDGVWRARGSGFVGEADTKDAAALNCFQAWLTADRAYFEGVSE